MPLTLLSLAACGGGGGAPNSPTVPLAPAGIPYTAGIFPSSGTFADQCAAPRTGTDRSTGRPYPDRAGSVAAENHFLRSWSNETYLWFDEIVDRDPSATSTTAAYFKLLKTNAALPSGQAKDRFHFTYNTASYAALSQSGVQGGYGIGLAVPATLPPRKIMVAYLEPGSWPVTAVSPAITRGAEILGVDGIDAVNDNTSSGVDGINAGLFPTAPGQSHTFLIRDRGATTTRSVTMTSANVTATPVQNVRVLTTASTPVGYLLFNDHIATAERGLVDAINTLKAGNVQDLVLDIRYNGGGYLDIASELAYMIAGAARTAGRSFERLQFNSKSTSTNPVTGGAITPTPFLAASQGFSVSSGQALPTLNLGRVFVLTTADTCSASESILNALNGIGLTVVQIGGNTCGKPYGFYPQDNCGTTYFSIQFRGINNAGFGDYPEGFSSTRSTGVAQANLPGCGTVDDFSHDLGDANEGQLAAALSWRATGSCPAGAALAPADAAPATAAATLAGGLPLQDARRLFRDNRILR